MVDLSPAKILVVLVVALVVLGPDKLPRVARQAGRLVNDVRKFRDGLNAEVREAFGDPGALSRLPTLSNLPAQGRAWVSSVTAAGGAASTSAQPTVPQASQVASGGPPGPPPSTSTHPSVPSPEGVSSGGPPEMGTESPDERPDRGVPPPERPDGGRPEGEGGFDPRFN